MRPLLSALAFLLLTLSAAAQDISWVRDGKTLLDSPKSTNSADRAAVIRSTLGGIGTKVIETDTLIARGEADFGKDYVLSLPAACWISEGAVWTTRCKIDATAMTKPKGTPGFVLVKGKYSFKGFTFIGRCYDGNEDGGLIGFGEPQSDADVTFQDCTLDGSQGNDWLFYNWSAGHRTVRFRNCTLQYARMGLTGLDSSGSYRVAIEAENCKFLGTADGSKSFGESSGSDVNRGGVLAGVLMRGGKATIRNSFFSSAGLTTEYEPTGKFGCPRIAAITDQYYSDGQPCQFLVDGCTFTVVPGTAKAIYDVEARRSKASFLPADGSNPDGTYRVYQGAK